jgi:chromate transport protein ChrA
VRRRRWLSREKFLDLLGASNLIPGRVQANWRYILATYAPDG